MTVQCPLVPLQAYYEDSGTGEGEQAAPNETEAEDASGNDTKENSSEEENTIDVSDETPDEDAGEPEDTEDNGEPDEPGDDYDDGTQTEQNGEEPEEDVTGEEASDAEPDDTAEGAESEEEAIEGAGTGAGEEPEPEEELLDILAEEADTAIDIGLIDEYTISENGTYRYTGTAVSQADSFITVKSDVNATIVLDNTRIYADKSAIKLEQGAQVLLQLTYGSSNALETDENSGFAAIHAPEGRTLAIMTVGDGSQGALSVKGSKDGAAIGGNSGEGAGEIKVFGGALTINEGRRSASRAEWNAAGIGGGLYGSGGALRFYGGETTVYVPDYGRGAGIGSGYLCENNSQRTDILIDGADIRVESANNSSGAGIGTGAYTNNLDLVIRSGNVTGKGAWGAGIGGGTYAEDINITIQGGTVEGRHYYERQAVDRTGAGIGTGYNGRGATILISGGNVTGWGGSGSAGIGSGSIAGKDEPGFSEETLKIEITGGTVSGDGGRMASGIGSGYVTSMMLERNTNIYISGSNTRIDATGGSSGAGIGWGEVFNSNIDGLTQYSAPVFTGKLTVDIRDATVDAGARSGAGIGSGSVYSSFLVDGVSPAQVSMDIYISGAKINADVDGGFGAGIGTDYTGSRVELDANIVIEDSVVYASGGTGSPNTGINDGGPGIGLVGAASAFVTGDITIIGSTINAESGGNKSAAIGVGAYAAAVNILLKDSEVTAHGQLHASAIGAGYKSKAVAIEIDGGVVNAYAGQQGAAIGGGHASANAEITIKDGTVNAYGHKYASAIGSGYQGAAATVRILGGNITAHGDAHSVAIGSGYDAAAGSEILIEGGNVKAIGGSYAAGIGAGVGTKADTELKNSHISYAGNIEITGGNVYAAGGRGAAGIGTGYQSAVCVDIMLMGGEITAVGGELVFADGNPVEPSAYAIGAGSAGELQNTLTVSRDITLKTYGVSPGRGFEKTLIRGDSAAVSAYVREDVLDTLDPASEQGLEIIVDSGENFFTLDLPAGYQSFGYIIPEVDVSLHYAVQDAAQYLLTREEYGEIEEITAELVAMPVRAVYPEPLKISQISEKVFLTLAYDGNGADGGEVIYSSSRKFHSGDSIQVASREQNTLVREGYTFSHWNTAPDGSGASYQPGETLVFGNEDVILYAQWEADDDDNDGNGNGGDENNGGGSNGGGKGKDSPVKEEAEILFHKAYVQGYPDGTFRVDNYVNRAEAVTMLYNLADEASSLQDSRIFVDLEAGAWYSDAVLYGEDNGIIVGYQGKFRPYDGITRAEMAAVITRAAELQELEGERADTAFTDVADSHWAAAYIRDAASKGWIEGYGDGTFRPDDYITRAEAVRMINAIYGRRADEEADVDKKRYSDLTEAHWAFWLIYEASFDHGYYALENGAEEWIVW